MANFARIVDNVAVDVINSDPQEAFHAELASSFVPVPDTVALGWIKSGTKWAAPKEVEPPAIPEPPKPPLAKSQFLAFLTREERLAIRGSRTTDAIADDFLLMLDETGTLDCTAAEAQAAFAHFVEAGYLTQQRVDEIAAL